MFLVMTSMPGGVTESDSGFCCCAPCLSGAIIPRSLHVEVNRIVFCPIYRMWHKVNRDSLSVSPLTYCDVRLGENATHIETCIYCTLEFT